jgi:hypothetical protein
LESSPPTGEHQSITIKKVDLSRFVNRFF